MHQLSPPALCVVGHSSEGQREGSTGRAEGHSTSSEDTLSVPWGWGAVQVPGVLGEWPQVLPPGVPLLVSGHSHTRRGSRHLRSPL